MPINPETGLVSLPPFISGVSRQTLIAKTVNSLIDGLSGRTITNLQIRGGITINGTATVSTTGALASGATAILTGDGYYLDYNGGTPRVRVGTVAASVLVKGIYFDGADLAWTGTNTSLTAAGVFTASDAVITGAITATSGAIGGWTIGATDLTGGNVVLYSSGQINTGTGNDVAILSASNATYRLWIGESNPVSAPFSVTKAGAFVATSATITGAITATSGSIGSFIIGTYLYTGTKTAWNDTNAGVHIGSDGIGIGNNVFTVNGSTGALVATSATITGAITATSGAIGGWTIGATTLTGGDVTLDSAGEVRVTNAGIDSTGHYVRPGASTSYFRIAQAGDTYVVARLYGSRDNVTPADNTFGLDILNHSTGAIVGQLALGGSVDTVKLLSSLPVGQYGLHVANNIDWTAYVPAAKGFLIASDVSAQWARVTSTGIYPGNQSTRYISDNDSNIVVDSVVVATHAHGGAGEGGTVAVASVTGAAPLASPTFTTAVTLPATINIANTAAISWNSGDVTLTHATNTLTFAGASSGYIFNDGNVFINDSANVWMTQGLTINQGGADNEILSFKSSDVAHGMTSFVETDTYGYIQKSAATEGDLTIVGLSSGTTAVQLSANHTTDNTTKSTAGLGHIHLVAWTKSGTSSTTPGADANLVAIRSGSTTRFLFDAEGSGHADVEWITYDKYDDLALIADMESELTARETASQTSRRHYLEQAGIIGKDSWHFENGKPRAMVNFTRGFMLHHGALLQVGQRLTALEEAQARLAHLEAKLARLEN